MRCASPTIWKTSTIKNSVKPEWNESRMFLMPDPSQILRIDVFDEDSGHFDKDDEIGYVRVSAGNLLMAPGGIMDCEILSSGRPTEAFITLHCEILSNAPTPFPVDKSTSTKI